MDIAQQKLVDLIQAETNTSVSTPVKKLSSAIASRGSVKAILFYGSGLWKEASQDTLYDFYVLVDRFRDFDNRISSAVLGNILSPNVYYMEIRDGNQTLRCKYAVIRIDQFEKAAKGKTITPQIWARFAQPCRIVNCDTDNTASRIYRLLKECVLTFHKTALAITPDNANAKDIWLSGLQTTYASELRSEKLERAEEIFTSNTDSFTHRSNLATQILSNIKRDDDTARTLNTIKRPLQKLVVFIRLMKASLTFEGAVDYVLWKIERQSGIKEEASKFQRQYPLLGAWPLVWRLWRKGAFR